MARNGSNKKGKLNKAISDPAFDRAYSLYGDFLGLTLLNQVCINGEVAERINTGKAMAAVNKIKI